jgi:hypothetical protein
MIFNTHAEYIAGIERANALVDAVKSEADPDVWENSEFCELVAAIEVYETANPQLFPNLKSDAS